MQTSKSVPCFIVSTSSWLRAGILVASLVVVPPSHAQPAPVPTQHNDLARTGANLNETILNTANINTNTFGLVYTRPVDDQIYAQPLVMTNVNIPGVGPRNIVIAATVNNSVYAYDADSASITSPYWMANFNSLPDIVPPRNTDMTGACGGDYPNYLGNIGIVGTPVIDPSTGTIYVVARTLEFKTTFVQRLHALDITTGAERPNSPVVITAKYPGNGSGSVNNVISFDPWRQNQRAGLTLVNGVVYIAWASHCDWTPFHGWVIGYNATTLQQASVYNDTPNGDLGGIWMSGQAIAADATGNLYLATGNGTADTSGTANRSMSLLKLTPSGTNLNVASWFMPHDWSALNNADLDLGSGGVLLVPGTTLAVGGGKGGKLYVVNRDAMGGVSAGGSDTNIVQSFPATAGNFSDDHVHGAPVWWDGPNGSYMYVWAESDYLRQYQFNRGSGLFTIPPIAQSPTHAPYQGMPGGIASVSANGTNSGTGVVWATVQLSGDANPNTRPGILHAYDAENVAHELWNSEQLGARDSVGSFAKYVPPTIWNGKVYLATFSSNLDVYGLLPQTLNSGPPQVFQQPQPPTAVRYTGTPISYQVPAGGFQPLSYQWSNGGIIIPGATNSTYTRSSLTLADSGTYTCTISNQFGQTNTSPVSLTVIPAPTSSYAQTILADNPVAYWRLDETNGSAVAHDYVGGHDGRYENVALGVPGFNPLTPDTAVGVGPAYNSTWTANSAIDQIAGIDFYGQGPNAEFSVEAWVKQNRTSADNGIVTLGFGGGGEQFCLSAPNGVFKFFVRSADFNAYVVQGNAGNDTNWHHVVGTIDQAAGSIRLYVDGLLVSAGAVPTGASVAAATTPISIGARESGWVTGNDLQLSAAIDDVALYNYPLSATQVRAHFGLENSVSGVPIILDPTGAIYTGASASSVFSSNFIAANLFNQDVTGLPLGVQLNNGGPGTDWAALGTSPAYVAFQLDQVYTLQALFYAQRVGGSASLDKISQMNIWASQTGPFNPLAPPTNAPAASVPITVSSSGIWSSYLLNAPIIGRYFLAEVQQNPTTGGNIGGSELRLGMVVPSVSLQANVISNKLVLNWPSPGVLLQADQITGPWTNATGIRPGTPIPFGVPMRFYRVRY